MKALVTGATGFIGTHLCRRLCRENVEVHAVSRTRVERQPEGVQWWSADLTDPAQVRELVAAVKPDVICHLASHVVGARGLEQVIPAFRGNLMSAVHVLHAATEVGGCRVVLTGSLEEPAGEEPLPAPSSPYAAAKWAASAYGRMFHALYGLDVVILRVFMVYGPAQVDVQKLVPYVILGLLRGEAPRLSSGQRKVDWIFVEDVVEAFVMAARKNDIAGRTIDVGSGTLVTVKTLVEHLNRLVNPEIKLQFGALTERPLEQVRVADIEETFRTLGWKPTVSLEEGLRLTVDWYKANRPGSAGEERGEFGSAGLPTPDAGL